MSSYITLNTILNCDTPISQISLSYLDIVSEVVCHDSPEYIKRDVGASMAHMRIVINGRSARVPCHFVRVDRCEQVFLTGEGVQDAKLWLLV